MGKKQNSAGDADVYEAMQDRTVFADLFNGSVFQGKQVIQPEMLEDVNEKKLLKAEGPGNLNQVIYRIKDVSKSAVMPGTLLRMVLNMEGQSEVHYGMPVKTMTYDAVSYAQQVKELARRNRKEKNLQGNAEFLSGLKKEDRLYPMLTIVFYYGEEQTWDGPLSLHEMLKFPPEIEDWREYIPDYKINLVYSKNVQPKNFRTGLREVFELLGVMANKEELGNILKEKEEYYSCLDIDTSILVSRFLNISLPEKKQDRGKGETVDMCTAIKEMIQDGEKRGEERGEKRGVERVIKLNQRLLAEKRYEDLEHASKDREYMQKLFEEFQIM